MSQIDVERFIGRLITDEEFLRAVKSSFQKACTEYGFSLTGAELRILQAIDFDKFSSFSGSLDSDIKRYSKKWESEGGFSFSEPVQ